MICVPLRSVTGTLLLAIALLQGCQSPKVDEAGLTPGQRDRNHGYALLFNLTNSEGELDKILIIKKPSANIQQLIRDIAQTSREAKDKLAAFAEQDITLNLTDPGLPEMESAARKSIESATTRALIFSDDTFEREIALTQVKALQYGAHLARVLADRDDHELRVVWLKQFADTYHDLYKRCVAMIVIQQAEMNLPSDEGADQ